MSRTALSIFISYSRNDSSFVDRLEADLQARNFRTWVDRRKLEGGQVWMDELESAIEHCQILLVILSPDAVNSQYVRMEYRYAHKLDKVVIPLEYKVCPKVPIDLNSLQWINFTQAYERGLESLLIALSPIELSTIPSASPPAQTAQTSLLLETREPDLVTPQPALPPPDPDLRALYRAGIVARAEGNYDRALVLWQQILDRDAQFQQGTIALQMTRLQKEVQPRRIALLRERAKQARLTGQWGQEIGAWQALLGLEPEDAEAKRKIPIAEYNQKYAWMYENALQFIEEGLLEPAKLQLELLWQDAPEYGDPAKIGRKVGILGKSKFKAFYLGTFSRMGSTSSTNSVKLTIDRIDDSGAVIATWVWNPDISGEIARCQGTIDNDTISLICQQGEHYSFTYTGFLQPDGSLKGEVVYTKNSTANYEGTLSPG